MSADPVPFSFRFVVGGVVGAVVIVTSPIGSSLSNWYETGADSLLFRFLDAKDLTSLEYKLDSFSSVYRRLTGKEVVFEFPVQAAQD